MSNGEVLREVNERLARIEGKLDAIPLHVAPCIHEHNEYKEAIDTLKTRVNLWGGGNTLGVVFASILASFKGG